MKKYLKKRKEAFGYAFTGIATLFRNEAHAKIHLAATILVVAAGLLVGLEKWEWCAIILCIGGVLMGEAFNTAIEKVCDKVSPERNHLIKIAKDVAAGAVLLFVLGAVTVGLIIFIPKFFF